MHGSTSPRELVITTRRGSSRLAGHPVPAVPTASPHFSIATSSSLSNITTTPSSESVVPALQEPLLRSDHRQQHRTGHFPPSDDSLFRLRRRKRTPKSHCAACCEPCLPPVCCCGGNRMARYNSFDLGSGSSGRRVRRSNRIQMTARWALRQPLILLMGLAMVLLTLMSRQAVEAFHVEPQLVQLQQTPPSSYHEQPGRRTKSRCTVSLSRHEMVLSGNSNSLSEFLEEHENNDKHRYRRRTPRRKQKDQASAKKKKSSQPTKLELELMQRILQLEELAEAQQVQIEKLNEQMATWAGMLDNFADVMKLLRESKSSSSLSAAAGDKIKDGEAGPPPKAASNETSLSTKDDESTIKKPTLSSESSSSSSDNDTIGAAAMADAENFDGIFATAPTTVLDAADAAGAAILAGLLAGKQRMLVDVRDAELTQSSETWSQFIELAILPVAAGLEGLRSQRNRLKLCFPTLAHLLQYHKTMTLSAPDVVALSTLGFDPVEQRDNLVVIVAPAPDDDQGLAAMHNLLSSASLNQPVVVLNHHMVPIAGPSPVDDFEVAYHLRLFSVQYVVGGDSYSDDHELVTTMDDVLPTNNATAMEAALEAAMQHAHQTGRHSGITRAMVIRAFPRPWHVFVDTSPDTEADFSVAATFDTVPTTDQINGAIVECLEGSEEEDDLVKQQMQEALESGQLDRVEDVLWAMGLDTLDDEEESDADDDDDIYRSMFGEDSV